MGHYDKDKAAAKRAAWIAEGLTSKGKPRKGRAIPKPHQAMKLRSKPKPPPKPPPRRETPEQRRERGRQLSASPMALAIEERVKKRLEAA